MWISLFFLQATLVFVLGDEYCILDLLKCDGYRVTFYERLYSRYLIERPTQLKRKCRALEPFMACVQEATLNCYRVGLTPIEAGFIETRRFVKQLCMSSDHELKKSFLKSADCINEYMVMTEEECDTAELRDAILEQVPALNFSCEYQKALLICKERIIHTKCGETASSLFRRTMQLELNMDYVCMDKTNFNEPGGFLSDIINGLVILLIDVFKPLLLIPEDLDAKEANNQHSSESTLTQALFSKNEQNREIKEKSRCLDKDCRSSKGASHEKHSKSMAGKYESKLRRIGDLKVNLKCDNGGKAFAHWNVETVSAIKFYKAVVKKVATLLELREKRLYSLAENCEQGECGKSLFSWKQDDFEPEMKDTVFEGSEADNDCEVQFENEDGLHVDRDSKTRDESGIKINFIIVGEAHLPLEINYSDGEKDYTRVADVKISNQKYRLTPSTETIPSMISEDAEQPTVSTTEATKTEESEFLEEKQNLYLADKMNEDIPEESTCEIRSNVTPWISRPRGPVTSTLSEQVLDLDPPPTETTKSTS